MYARYKFTWTTFYITQLESWYIPKTITVFFHLSAFILKIWLLVPYFNALFSIRFRVIQNIEILKYCSGHGIV